MYKGPCCTQPTSCSAALRLQGMCRRLLKNDGETCVRRMIVSPDTRRPNAFSTGTTCAAWPKPWDEMEHQSTGIVTHCSGGMVKPAARWLAMVRLSGANRWTLGWGAGGRGGLGEGGAWRPSVGRGARGRASG